MRIKQVSVNGLFGIFDHVIPLNDDERITIVHGPNGFGKTAMLRVLNGFFNSRYSVVRTIPFSNFRVELDNSSSIEIVKSFETSGKTGKRDDITFNFYEPNSEPVSFPVKGKNTPPDIDFPIDILDDIPELRRVGSKVWRYVPTGETLSINEVIERFEDVLPSKIKLREEPEWLENLKNNIHVRLIESQRLLNFAPSRSSRLYSGMPSMLPTVSAYSDELAQLIQSKLAEYATTSQSLDRTFPTRVIKQLSTDLTDEQLRHQLE
jgi:energy-coupling factor transporter ATP-binding protein EcfA2